MGCNKNNISELTKNETQKIFGGINYYNLFYVGGGLFSVVSGIVGLCYTVKLANDVEKLCYFVDQQEKIQTNK